VRAIARGGGILFAGVTLLVVVAQPVAAQPAGVEVSSADSRQASRAQSQSAAQRRTVSDGRADASDDDPEPFRRVIYIEQNPAVSGSVAYRHGTGAAGSKTLKLDAPGDFRNGQYVEIDHAGGPCKIWSAGECRSLDNIRPMIAVHGAHGKCRYCVQISVLDNNGGISRALNPAGGTRIADAPNHLDRSNYVTIRYNRATKNGQIKPGDQAYVFWVSTAGRRGPWTKRGVMNLPTQGITPIVDDQGGAKLVYDEDQVPMLNTTEPPTPDPSDYWWIPDSPPAHDLSDWLLTRIAQGGGTTSLALANPIADPDGVKSARVNHDDGPPIQELFSHLGPHTEIVFGPRTYRFFQLMYGNGARSLNAIAIGADPANGSDVVVAGAGIDTTVLQMSPCFNAGDGIQIQGSPSNHVKSVVVRDLTIDNRACGFLPNGPTSAALDTSYAEDVTIEQVRAINGATATVWVGAGVGGYNFDQSEASGGWGDVFHADCGEREPCPRNILVAHSRFPIGGADGGFGVLSNNSLDAARDVHVDYNDFGCGAGFQGVVGGDFVGNQIITDNKHLFDAGLFAPDGIHNYGNSDLYIAFNNFDKKTAYGYGGTDSYGNPPSAVQLGDVHTGDNLNPVGHQGGRIRFEHNSVTTNEPINLFVCDRLASIENNSIHDFGRGPNHHGLHLACNPGVTANTSNVMGGNSYMGQAVAVYTGNAANVPRFTTWDSDAATGVPKLIDYPARINHAAEPTKIATRTSDGIQRQQTSISGIPPARTTVVSVVWASPFADANYVAVCSVLRSEPGPLTLRVHRIASQTATEVAVKLVNDDPKSAHAGTLTCQALHY
jgi:hypothetical protein